VASEVNLAGAVVNGLPSGNFRERRRTAKSAGGTIAGDRIFAPTRFLNEGQAISKGGVFDGGAKAAPKSLPPVRDLARFLRDTGLALRRVKALRCFLRHFSDPLQNARPNPSYRLIRRCWSALVAGGRVRAAARDRRSLGLAGLRRSTRSSVLPLRRPSG
jgi:hypothetical protein